MILLRLEDNGTAEQVNEASYGVENEAEGEGGMLCDIPFGSILFEFKWGVVVIHTGDPGSLAVASC